jgi:hypothetical protein
MDKSELKKDFLEFVAYLKKMAIIHDDHSHVVEHRKTGDSGMKNTGKAATRAATVLDTTLVEGHMEVAAIRRLTVIEQSPAMEGRQIRLALESSRPGSLRLVSTRKGVRARSTTCPTVPTMEMT